MIKVTIKNLIILWNLSLHEYFIAFLNLYSAVKYITFHLYFNLVQPLSEIVDTIYFFSDFGFKEDPSGHCIRDEESEADPKQVPETCISDGYYNRTKGYVQVILPCVEDNCFN